VELNLKKALIDRGMTQVSLARKLNVDDTLLSKYMNGHKAMPEPVKGKVARILKIKKTELFGN